LLCRHAHYCNNSTAWYTHFYFRSRLLDRRLVSTSSLRKSHCLRNRRPVRRSFRIKTSGALRRHHMLRRICLVCSRMAHCCLPICLCDHHYLRCCWCSTHTYTGALLWCIGPIERIFSRCCHQAKFPPVPHRRNVCLTAMVVNLVEFLLLGGDIDTSLSLSRSLSPLGPSRPACSS
jgi:hypothetical protein